MLRFSRWYSVQRGNIVERKVLRKRGETKYSIVLFLSTPQSKVVRQIVNVLLTVACVYSPAAYWMGVGMISYCGYHMLLDKEQFVVTVHWASRIERSIKKLELCGDNFVCDIWRTASNGAGGGWKDCMD